MKIRYRVLYMIKLKAENDAHTFVNLCQLHYYTRDSVLYEGTVLEVVLYKQF